MIDFYLFPINNHHRRDRHRERDDSAELNDLLTVIVSRIMGVEAGLFIITFVSLKSKSPNI
jgi:hypothetical protein